MGRDIFDEEASGQIDYAIIRIENLISGSNYYLL